MAVSSRDAANLLREYRLKRQRGIAHLEHLRAAVQEATGPGPQTVAGDYEAGRRCYRFQVPLAPIDPDWTLVLGDAVHNLRAALDYLISALVTSTGGEVTRRNEFPIFGISTRRESPSYWGKINDRWEADARGEIKRKLAGAPPGTKERLKPLQPFYGTPRTDPFRHPLHQLQDLSNRDKHRRLNLLSRVASDVQFVDSAGKSIYPGPPHRIRIPDAGDGRSLTVTLNVQEPRSEGIFVHARTTIGLNEPPELTGEVVETLGTIAEYIETKVEPTVRQLI